MKQIYKKLAKMAQAPKVRTEAPHLNQQDLMKINPLREQFEPTPQEPVRQHYKMAGGC